MFNKLREKYIKSKEDELIHIAENRTKELVRQQEAISRKLEDDHILNERLKNELEYQSQMLSNKILELKERTKKLDDELELIRQGTPQRMYEAAISSGFNMSFDFLYRLQHEYFMKYVTLREKEIRQEDSERYSRIISNHTGRINKSISPHIVGIYDNIVIQLDRASKLGFVEDAKLYKAKLEVLEPLINFKSNGETQSEN